MARRWARKGARRSRRSARKSDTYRCHPLGPRAPLLHRHGEHRVARRERLIFRPIPSALLLGLAHDRARNRLLRVAAAIVLNGSGDDDELLSIAWLDVIALRVAPVAWSSLGDVEFLRDARRFDRDGDRG